MTWQKVHSAVARSDLAKLTKLGTEVSTRRSRETRSTALHVAIKLDKSEVVDYLLHNYPHLTRVEDGIGEHALDYARIWHQYHFIPKLIAACPQLMFMQHSHFGTTALQRAVEQNCVVSAQLMLKENPDAITSVSEDGRTLLHFATKCSKNVEMVRFLAPLPPGFIFSMLCDNDSTALQRAVELNCVEMVQILFEANASVVDRWSSKMNFEQTTPFLLAVERGFIEIVDFFLRVCPHVVNHRCKNSGKNAIFVAPDLNMINKLLHASPSLIDSRDVAQNTPLHDAVRCKDPRRVSALFAAKPSLIEVQNIHLHTPLEYAFIYGTHEFVNMFLDNMPNAIYMDVRFNTSLHIAVYCCKMQVLKKVLHHNKHLMQFENIHGSTPFQLAVEHCKLYACYLMFPYATVEMIDNSSDIPREDIDLHIQPYFECLQELLLPVLKNIVFEYLNL